MIILETPHFILRHVTHDDTLDYLEFWNDPNVMKLIGDGTWGGGLDVVTRCIEKNIKAYKLHPEFGYWAVQDKQTGHVIGEAGLMPMKDSSEIEAGYLFHQTYWGKGYATEVLTGLLNYGFQKLKLKQITAVAHPENHGSIKVMKKCGMTFEKMGWYHNRYSVKYFINRT